MIFIHIQMIWIDDTWYRSVDGFLSNATIDGVKIVIYWNVLEDFEVKDDG